MEYQGAYPNRRSRRQAMQVGKLSKTRRGEPIWEFGIRVSENIKNGKKLHELNLDRSLKLQETFLMQREESYRSLLKTSGLSNKEIDTAISKWHDIVFKQK